MDFSIIQGSVGLQSVDGPINQQGHGPRIGLLGNVAVTGVFDLPACWVIRGAVMPPYGDGRATENSIHGADRQVVEGIARAIHGD